MSEVRRIEEYVILKDTVKYNTDNVIEKNKTEYNKVKYDTIHR